MFIWHHYFAVSCCLFNSKIEVLLLSISTQAFDFRVTPKTFPSLKIEIVAASFYSKVVVFTFH
jgi:hypothetical protein